MRRRKRELTEARLEHIETLERLGRLVVSVGRSPARVCFVRIDAFQRHADEAVVVATDDYLLDFMEIAA